MIGLTGLLAEFQVQPENPEGNSQSFDNIFTSVVQVIIISSSKLAIPWTLRFS
jgi:hypothetical protein